jgi:hypothetical protein
LRVIIDGYDLGTKLADTPGVRNSDFTFWDYSGGGMDFPLDPQFAAAAGAEITPPRPGAQVPLTVIPEGFVGPGWRITYLTADQKAASAGL